MDKISVIIASITEDFESLQLVINSILRENCPKIEIILVTPHYRPIKNKKVICIKEKYSTGSCAAYNLGLKYAQGDQIVINTDDILFKNNWWKGIEGDFVSLKTGELFVRVPHIFSFNRKFLNDHMHNCIFNKSLTHMYIDNDLGFRLAKQGIIFTEFEVSEAVIIQEGENKKNSKLRSFRLDGIIFNYIWAKKYPNLYLFTPLYEKSLFSDEELVEKVQKQLLKDISGELDQKFL